MLIVIVFMGTFHCTVTNVMFFFIVGINLFIVGSLNFRYGKFCILANQTFEILMHKFKRYFQANGVIFRKKRLFKSGYKSLIRLGCFNQEEQTSNVWFNRYDPLVRHLAWLCSPQTFIVGIVMFDARRRQIW